ncbi:hypothetical protein ACN2XU_03810 [Primorskyibacter sp. 2E107]|uniref:hypothetical protein n=1 Tax=Primorskyibacter sp. 2E107 TaxID=3403458 RepID=UPI003AF8896C
MFDYEANELVHPDSCPRCGTCPYPQGAACLRCGLVCAPRQTLRSGVNPKGLVKSGCVVAGILLMTWLFFG